VRAWGLAGTYIEPIILPPQPIEQQMSIHLTPRITNPSTKAAPPSNTVFHPFYLPSPSLSSPYAQEVRFLEPPPLLPTKIATDVWIDGGTNLRLDQHQIDKQHHKIMLDIFVREALAARTLRQPHAFAETAVVGFAVFVVEPLHGVAAFDADGHSARVCGFGTLSG